MSNLHHFHGGMRLPGHKSLSNQSAIQAIAAPDTLVLPLQQSIGEMNEVLVGVGDKVRAGQLLASSQATVSAPIHAPLAGEILAIEERPVAHPSGLNAPCVVLQVDQAAPTDHDIAGSDASLNSPNRTPDELLQIVRDAGISGLGGAVFPTQVKLSAGRDAGVQTLIINGAECEPYISCDDRLMRERADEVFLGIAVLQQILNAKQILIGIEDNKPEAISAMQQALQHSSLTEARIMVVPTRYPTGGEKQLIEVLTGRQVPAHGLAFAIGILCINVGTCAAIHQAVNLQRALTQRIVTVTGHGICNPGNYEVPLGTPIEYLLQQAGGLQSEPHRLIMGGPMMGFSLASSAIPVVKATNSILVATEADFPLQQATTHDPCIRCGACVEVCPALLLPQQLFWFARSDNTERLREHALFDCIECGCCASVCPSQIPLVQYYRAAKSEIRNAELARFKADRARLRHEFRQERQEAQKRADEERRKQKQAALAAKKARDEAAAAQADPAKAVETKSDPAKDAIAAALERVKAKQANSAVKPLNTENLTLQQQKQIDAADKRRQEPSE